jgi:hypothetical protein
MATNDDGADPAPPNTSTTMPSNTTNHPLPDLVGTSNPSPANSSPSVHHSTANDFDLNYPQSTLNSAFGSPAGGDGGNPSAMGGGGNMDMNVLSGVGNSGQGMGDFGAGGNTAHSGQGMESSVIGAIIYVPPGVGDYGREMGYTGLGGTIPAYPGLDSDDHPFVIPTELRGIIQHSWLNMDWAWVSIRRRSGKIFCCEMEGCNRLYLQSRTARSHFLGTHICITRGVRSRGFGTEHPIRVRVHYASMDGTSHWDEFWGAQKERIKDKDYQPWLMGKVKEWYKTTGFRQYPGDEAVMAEIERWIHE